MLSRFRARLTYANVMATIAVFIALGGTSYAAIKVTGKNVTDSSLTGADVKNSSLTTKDVKDRSLRAMDFKAGQLPAGPQGPPGVGGAKGDQGDRGLQGDRGPSESWTAELVAGSASITLPPGDYVAHAVARWQNASTTDPAVHECIMGVIFPARDPHFGVGTTTVPPDSWGSVSSTWAFSVRNEPGGGGGTQVNCGADTNRGVLVVTRVATLQYK